MQSQPKSKKRRSGPAEAHAAVAARPRKPAPTPAARALRLLSLREHTRSELERKLAPHVEDAVELSRVLDDFTARGWLSEARAAEQLVRARRGRFGAARIRQVLTEKGVPRELISTSLEGLRESELDTARAVWGRKFKNPPATAAERARHVRFLQARGFSVDIAMRVVRSAGADDAGDF